MKKIYCHWDLLRFLSEKDMKSEDGKDQMVSVAGDGYKYDFGIYLYKSTDGYDAKIIKCKGNDKYVPDKEDKVVSFTENNRSIIFHFKNFNDARNFADSLGYRHPEYRNRQFRPIKKG